VTIASRVRPHPQSARANLRLGDVDIVAKLRYVGPDEARALLDANIHNRSVKGLQAQKWTGAMAREEWVFNGDPVRVAVDGTLLDGQHRLLSIIESGTTQILLIISGLDPKSQETMDIGAKRSPGDVLALRGESYPRELAAAARKLWYYERLLTVRRDSRDPTLQQLLNVLDRHPGLRDATKDGLRITRRLKNYQPATAAVLSYIFPMVDVDDAAMFFERLLDGANLAVDDPINQLRNRLLEEKPRGQRLADVDVAALTIKAFNLWRRGERRQMLAWRSGGAHAEQFPLIDDLNLTPKENT
jgi:hypothetical protein